MKESFSYSLAVRLGHFVSLFLLVLMFATSDRLVWENNCAFSIGAHIPSPLSAQAMGDRGVVQARGRWYNGEWTVELARRISTGSSFDAAFRGEWYLGIAPFHNSVCKHAYHLKPIKLVIEQH